MPASPGPEVRAHRLGLPAWLFVPAVTSVYRIKTKVRGRKEPFMSN